MSDIDNFSEKVKERISRNQKELKERQLETNENMRQMLEQQESFKKRARNIVAAVVYPRMEELSRHFENAKLLQLDPEHDFNVVCEFSHTSRYPAKVTLDIALLPLESFSTVDVHYGLNILPMLVEYQRSDEKKFSLDAEDEIGNWVEERLLGFLETYLQLQVHPLYQKDNLVSDPVCNMQFPVDEAAGSVNLHGRTFYFCSKACQDAFSKEQS